MQYIVQPYSGHSLFILPLLNEWMNEWMKHLYSALLCIVVHPKRFTIIWGGLSSTTTSVQHPLGWCDGSHRTTAPVRSPHTSYRWRGEREIELIKWMGIIGRPWLTKASGGNLARIIVDGCMEEDKSKKCNQHQGRQFLSDPLLFLILTLIFIFTPDIYISVQNIGYRSTWSVIIGIGIGPEKHISVDPYTKDNHLIEFLFY